MVPFPLPVPPLTTVIHAALLWVVHEQPAVAVTLSDPVAPPVAALALVALSEYAQVPAWFTVNV